MVKGKIGQAVWPSGSKASGYPALDKDLDVDIAIVGGGITGITAAYLLSKTGKSVVVLEARQVGKGTTGSSTGNLYAHVDVHLQTIESKHGEEVLGKVVAARMAAINFIERQVQDHSIDCDFQRVPYYLFTTPDTNSRNKIIEDEFNSALKGGLAPSAAPVGDFPFPYDKMVAIHGQAQFNPLKYVQHMAAVAKKGKVSIFENTQVTDVEEHSTACIVTTPGGKVLAKKVIMATHTPKGIYSVHTMMEPCREYAIAARLKQPLPEPGMYWHLQEKAHYSIRPYRNGDDQYLLVIGEAHKVGQKESNEDNVRKVEGYLRRYFEVEDITYSWAAQNYKAADALPYIGKSLMEGRKYIATGFAADGLVYGTLAAMIIADLINKKENQWADTFSPTRFTPKASAKNFLKENIDVATHLVKDLLFYGKSEELENITSGEGRTVKINDEKLAVYRDEEGQLHMVSGICPHMGCAVHWNDAERSWDCPCHGSRFSVDGEVLEGPAYKGLAKPEGRKE